MRVNISDKDSFNFSFNEIITGAGYIKSNGLSIDSRNIKKGDIFFALKGDKVDGHKYINQAYKSGASMAIIDDNIEYDLPTYKVPSVRDFINNLSSKYRDSFNQPIIGITGSNGKTSTKDLLVHILSSSMDTSFSRGNYNSTLGAPLSLFECNKADDISVIEMGASKPGEIEYICNIVKPEMGIITNIAGAHLEKFGTIEEIVKTKSALFDQLPCKGTAFINIDDNYLKDLHVISKKITFSFNKRSDFSCRIQKDGKIIKINDTEINLKFSSKSIIYNILATFAISSTIGIKENKIKESIEKFETTNGRGNILKLNGVSIINDSYNANLESTINGIESLINNFIDNRKIVIIGDMLELGSYEIDHHKKLGEFLFKKNIDAVFSYGKLTRFTIEVLKKSRIFNKHYLNKNSLILELNKFLLKGDAIYLKGSRSMKMEEIIEGLRL